MLMEWYWRNEGETHGPFTEEELIQLAQDGQIEQRCEVRLGADGRWYTAGKVKGLFTPKPDSAADANHARSEDTLSGSDDSSITSLRLKRAKPLAPKVRAVSASDSAIIQPAQDSSIIQAAPPAPAPPSEQPPVAPANGFAVQTGDGNSAATVPVSQRPRRKSSSLGLILVLGFIGVGMAAVLAFAFFWNGGSTDVASAEEEPASAAQPDDESAEPDTPTAEATSATDKQLLTQVTTFHDATRSRIKLNPAKVQVSEAWISPAADGNDEQLFVKIQITNVSDEATWSYSSFNGTGTVGVEAQARLFDNEDQLCQLVPVAKRAQQWCPPTVPLAPGQSVEDVLVFAKPSGDMDRLRLVLPRAAVALSGAPMGYQLPRKMLASAPQEAPTDAPADTAPATPETVVDDAKPTENTVASADKKPETPDQPKPAPAAADTNQPADDGPQNGALPATINGLLDSINNFDKPKDDPQKAPQDMPPKSDGNG